MSRRPPFAIPRHAWTGGDAPARGVRSAAERSLCREDFRGQCRLWLEAWGAPLPLDVARIFWVRARGDAFAAVREYARRKPATARRDERLTGWTSRVSRGR